MRFGTRFKNWNFNETFHESFSTTVMRLIPLPFFFLGEKVSPTLINQGLQNRASHGQHFVSGVRRDERKFLEKFCHVA